jgi:hypothetical protein
MSKSKKQKREEAILRQELYNQLSALDRIKNINNLFGENKGASKERRKLGGLIINETRVITIKPLESEHKEFSKKDERIKSKEKSKNK